MNNKVPKLIDTKRGEGGYKSLKCPSQDKGSGDVPLALGGGGYTRMFLTGLGMLL